MSFQTIEGDDCTMRNERLSRSSRTSQAQSNASRSFSLSSWSQWRSSSSRSACGIPQADLDELERHCDQLLSEKERLAFDWAWDVREDRDKRSFRIVQSSPSIVWKDIADQPYRKWLVAFASTLMNLKLD